MRRVLVIIMASILILLAAGCIKEADTYLFKGRDGDWSIDMQKEFTKSKEESDEQLKSYTVTFKTESDLYFIINEMTDEKLEINQDRIKEELSLDEYLQVERYDSIDIPDVGTAYGALVFDKATNTAMMYHRLKYKDKVISFISHYKNDFTDEQEAKVKSIISSLKILK
ncbi:MAG TPA: hypothetical protein P5510_00980 [Clostridia bacterium]|nr:hypothetical protein [Clostridia bacterium]